MSASTEKQPNQHPVLWYCRPGKGLGSELRLEGRVNKVLEHPSTNMDVKDLKLRLNFIIAYSWQETTTRDCLPNSKHLNGGTVYAETSSANARKILCKQASNEL